MQKKTQKEPAALTFKNLANFRIGISVSSEVPGGKHRCVCFFFHQGQRNVRRRTWEGSKDQTKFDREKVKWLQVCVCARHLSDVKEAGRSYPGPAATFLLKLNPGVTTRT